MCLPTCPTYQLSKNENESPRGRIALMHGIVQEDLPLTSKAIKHLDHCLGCLSCEDVCPSNVKYEELIDGIREYTVNKQNNSFTKLFISLLTRANIQKIIFSLLRLYQLSGVQWLSRRSGLLKITGVNEQEELLPKLNKRLSLKPFYPTQKKSLGTVNLFTGCMGNAFEQNAISTSIGLLNKLGYDISIPKQVCCGALHQHSGFKKQANELANTNNQLLFQDNPVAVVFTASGCGAQLTKTLHQAETPVTSILDFVQQHVSNHSIVFNPVKTKVAVHQPCSLQNSLKQSDAVLHVLNKIPDLELIELQSQCCGAAGKNMLTETKIANQIRQPLLTQIKATQPDQVITSNIGCLLHLRAGIEKNIPLIHPVELIAKSIV